MIGRGDYHWQHEPCWYAVRGKRPLDRRPQADDAVADRAAAARTPRRCTARRSRSSACAGRSRTTAARARRSTSRSLARGTTLIAAEMTGRVCHAIELRPAYVDVAVRRWQAFTGRTAVLRTDPHWAIAARELLQQHVRARQCGGRLMPATL